MKTASEELDRKGNVADEFLGEAGAQIRFVSSLGLSSELPGKRKNLTGQFIS